MAVARPAANRLPKKLAEVPEVPLDHPAFPAEAAQRLDLTTFPLMEGATNAMQRSLANLSYRVEKTDVKKAYEFQKKNLIAQRWKELPNTSVTDQYASATFGRAGFHVSVMVNPSQDGLVDVTLHNHGNVDLSKLPKPAKTKDVYVGPITALYVTETSVEATKAECEKLLLADGWQPYGILGDMRCYKKNAVQIKTSVVSAPAQGGKTMITYHSEQLSADIPLMPGADKFRVIDSTGRWDFETKASEAAVSPLLSQGARRSRLAGHDGQDHRDQWQEHGHLPQCAEGHDHAGDEDGLWRGESRISLFHQSATTVAEIDRKLDAQAEARKAKMKAEAAKPAVVFVPASATVVSQTGNEIKFTMRAGTARALAQTWGDKYHETGWLQERGGYEGGRGRWAFKREGQTLVFVYTDEGGAPAEVTVTSTGIPLERGSGQ